MNSDILLFIIFQIPFVIVCFHIDRLKEKYIFRNWFLIAICIVLVGIMIEDNSNNELRSLSYFGSQTLLIFLVLQKITRNIYFKIYVREPEFGKFPKNKVDYIYTFIIAIGTMILPFLIDDFLFHKFFNP